MSPVFFLAVLEAGLRAFGYGYPASFFVKLEDGATLTTNQKFAGQFYPRETATQPHPLFVSVQKPPGAFRIFILGESAAAGTPDPAFGFARILEMMLRRRFPDRQFEVINAAMRGINSHIILPIARECARLQPDLFLVYMGNNEAIGLHAPDPTGFNVTPYLRLLRLGQWMKSTRTAQWLESTIRLAQKSEASNPRQQDAEYFRRHRLAADHPRRQAVYDNFRANLEDIGRAIREAGAKAIVSTVAVNLKDFPPLGSLHRASLTEPEKNRWEASYAEGVAAEKSGQHEKAMQHFTEALRLDDHFAELHFRLGRCYAATGQFNQAREHYRQARDRDAMQFRSDSRINDIARHMASGREAEGLFLVDAEQAFEESPLSDHKIPGEKLFNDHVHFTFEGDYLLAQTVRDAVEKALALSSPAKPAPTLKECAAALAFTSWDEFNVADAMARMTAKPPFVDQLEHAERQRRAELSVSNRLSNFRRADLERAIRVYRQALAQKTNDWQLLYNFGGLLADSKDYKEAITQYETVVKLYPKLLMARLALGDVLMKAGKLDQAVEQFREAHRIAPDFRPAQEALEQSESQVRRIK
ncbi:MAG: tetratricopeptide repeat protein [Verrucomicrobia bacterium]|nr:tetratricopeptide repeat protein [Verrucomicrobiota bacterium]